MTTATTATDNTEFHSSKEYLALTEKQKVWVDRFIETQDAALATKLAYGDHTDETYRAMLTRKIETSNRVCDALDVFYQRDEKDKFIRNLELNIKNSTGIAKIEGQKLLARILGLLSSDAEQVVAKVGDVVLVDGVKHRVTAIDANGKPTDGEPL